MARLMTRRRSPFQVRVQSHRARVDIPSELADRIQQLLARKAPSDRAHPNGQQTHRGLHAERVQHLPPTPQARPIDDPDGQSLGDG
jgi:hypothetical protein